MDDKLKELRKLEAEDRTRRMETAARMIQEIFVEYGVEFQYLAKAPSGGVVQIKDLLPPGWGFVANVVAKDVSHE